MGIKKSRIDQYLALSIAYRKRYEIRPQLLWNTNRNSYMIYRTVTFSITSSDLAKYSVTQSIVRPLCDSWASC